MGDSQAGQAVKELGQRSNSGSQRAERRAQLERVSLFFLVACTVSFLNVSLSYVATFDKRERKVRIL